MDKPESLGGIEGDAIVPIVIKRKVMYSQRLLCNKTQS